MTIKVVQFSQIGAVTLKRNRRSKNIRISVKPDHTVLVSFPWFVSTREVTDFVQKNTGWITEQQKKISSRRKILTEGTIIETKLFTISILKGQKNEARRTGNSIEISLVEPDSENATKYVENILLQFYRFEAKKYCLQGWANWQKNTVSGLINSPSETTGETGEAAHRKTISA